MTSATTTVVVVALTGAIGAATAVAHAAPRVWEPPTGHRALASGFELDPALPSELPTGFYRLLSRDSGRAGLPPFGRVGVSDAQSAVGSWSLEFTLAGGGMAVVTEPSSISISAGEVIETSVMALSQGLERSRARLVLRALDARNAPIVGAEWIADATDARGWQRLTVRSGPMPDGARAAEVALELRPRDHEDSTGDVTGRLAFDEIEVWRIPRVQVELDRGGAPMGVAPQRAVVRVVDPVGGARVRSTLIDQDGRTLLEWSGTSGEEMSAELPALAPGCYSIEVAVDDGAAQLLVRESKSIAVAERLERSPSSAHAIVEFGFWIERPRQDAMRVVMESILLARPNFVVVELDDASEIADGRLTLPEIRRFVDDLRLAGIEPVLRISRTPEEAAARNHLEADDPAGLFGGDDDAWRTVFGPWFERCGHVVSRWMIASRSGHTNLIETALDGLVPGFEQLEGAVQIVETTSGASRAGADDAAARGIALWREGARRVALRGALSAASSDGVTDGPGAAALAWRALAAAARGASSCADLEAGSELECLLLSGEPTARVLVWRRDGGEPRRISLPFDGESLHATDALGAPVALERRQGAITAEIGSSPVVIDGVDPILGAFLASMRFEPRRLEGSTAEQSLKLRLTNPWNVTLEGTLRFVAPLEWSFVPRLKRFSLPPGATALIGTTVALPRTQVTGSARVGVEMEFTADRGYALRVNPPIDIEVDAFLCDATLRRVTLTDGRAGAVVELLLTNRADRTLELESTISTTSGLARRDGPIRVVAGASARRTIRIDEAVIGSVVISISQTNGPLRLVRTLP